MATQSTRREFLADVGRGMFVAGIGFSGALDLGLARKAFAEETETPLHFGEYEPLVALMQETPPEKLLPILAEKLSSGIPLKTLLTAGVLANGRSFGGEDYIGFHTLMALGPAYYMAQELPSERRALPVLKVLYRNASRIQDTGGHAKEALHAVEALAARQALGPLDLREATRRQDKQQAEKILAAIAQGSADDAFNALLVEVEDETEVHRVNIAYKPWDLLNIIGREHALTMLRQGLRYCVKQEQNGRYQTREMLAKLFDQFGLEGLKAGDRQPDDAWIESMSMTFFTSTPDQAAEAAAAALKDGIAADAVAQAAALAANQLVLRDPGRAQRWADAKKPVGSVHGDSVGVHACDAVNAWRNIARVSNSRNQNAAVVLAAYHVARDRGQTANWTEDGLLKTDPRPWGEDFLKVRTDEPAKLLAEAEDAIRQNDQARAAVAVHCYGETKADARPVFDLLLKYAISEDGALHAEKYYRTVSEEFASWRPAFRWRQLTALARVTASEHGYPAPGYADACRLLKIS
jgi:hypothetical protein